MLGGPTMNLLIYLVLTVSCSPLLGKCPQRPDHQGRRRSSQCVVAGQLAGRPTRTDCPAGRTGRAGIAAAAARRPHRVRQRHRRSPAGTSRSRSSSRAPARRSTSWSSATARSRHVSLTPVENVKYVNGIERRHDQDRSASSASRRPSTSTSSRCRLTADTRPDRAPVAAGASTRSAATREGRQPVGHGLRAASRATSTARSASSASAGCGGELAAEPHARHRSDKIVLARRAAGRA